MKKAIFMDRDGVLVRLPKGREKYGFTCRREEVLVLPGVVDALRKFKELRYFLCVITNQPPVARGIMSYKEVENIHNYINTLLDGMIDKFYFCPHHPEMHDDVPTHARKYRIVCDCRKPAPGMILKAAEEFNIELEQSWMIGDMITDIAAGEAAGCKTVMVKSESNDRRIIPARPYNENVEPDYCVSNLLEASEIISKN